MRKTTSTCNRWSIHVSADKAAEIEYKFVESEIRSRTEFSKRIIGFQVLLCTSCFALIGAMIAARPDFQGDFNIKPLVTIIASALMVINAIFSVELCNLTRGIYVAAKYCCVVLGKKYKISGSTRCRVSEWELYLNAERVNSPVKSLPVFGLSTPFIFCIVITMISGIVVYMAGDATEPTFYLGNVCCDLFSASVVGFYGWIGHEFAKKIKMLATEKEIGSFQKKYDLLK